MNSLFDPKTAQTMLKRIENLPIDAPRMWGKMDVAQMMAHCNVSLETATGKIHPQRTFIGKLIGGFLKGMLTDDKPMTKNAPTHPTFIMVDSKDFTKEKSRFITLLKEFSEDGEAGLTKSPHPFFGKITPQQWSSGVWKHLDHHLRQFGA
ncbi:MAG: DUF1569 domain-containing protein [Arcicella sp.]|nr:DUF1569 domain-containing protein [Arcicella sp.]